MLAAHADEGLRHSTVSGHGSVRLHAMCIAVSRYRHYFRTCLFAPVEADNTTMLGQHIQEQSVRIQLPSRLFSSPARRGLVCAAHASPGLRSWAWGKI